MRDEETGGFLTEEIDKCIVHHFGAPEIPVEEEITIKKISDIASCVQKLRKLKYGPRLTVGSANPKKYTIQYQAGFNKENQYAESMYIFHGGDGSYQKIEFDLATLKREINSNPIASIIPLISECIKKLKNHEIHSLFVNKFKEVFEQYSKVNTSDWSEKDLNILAYKMYEKLVPNIKNWEVFIGSELSEEFENIIKEEQTLSMKIDRIFTIWFLAESFRYPPMLLYSILLLHLYVNGVREASDIKDALPNMEETSGLKHPSDCKSEKAEYYCYLREINKIKNLSRINGSFNNRFKNVDFQNLTKYLTTRKESLKVPLKEIESRKLAILRDLRDHIYLNFRVADYPEKTSLNCANILFVKCIKRYLNMCVVENANKDVQPNFEKLVKNLGNVQEKWKKKIPSRSSIFSEKTTSSSPFFS